MILKENELICLDLKFLEWNFNKKIKINNILEYFNTSKIKTISNKNLTYLIKAIIYMVINRNSKFNKLIKKL